VIVPLGARVPVAESVVRMHVVPANKEAALLLNLQRLPVLGP
jgi:hypothetical protein